MSIGLLIGAVVVGIYTAIYYGLGKQQRFKKHCKIARQDCDHNWGQHGHWKEHRHGLGKRGARVILACRNKQRAEAAVLDIKRESGNAEVRYMHLDLASLKSVRSFAETFLKTEPRLDLLINNAGLLTTGKTEDGFDIIFGVNHLGHFLLTLLLLERLKESSASRVINVSSAAHQYGHIDFDHLSTHKDLGVGDSLFGLLVKYSHSKLCNVLFTHELAKRLQGTSVTCYSLHPGQVRTEMGRHVPILWRIILAPVYLPFSVDSDSGAQTVLYCALQEGIEGLSGSYFSNSAVVSVSAKAKDDAVARRLWEVSERLCGLA